MKRTIHRRALSTLVLISTCGLLAAGCASSAGSSDGGAEPKIIRAEVIGEQAPEGNAIGNATLTYASHSLTNTLDPIKGRTSPWLGGTEMAAIYDVLVRWDPESANFAPQLAESITEAADRLSWTIKLRDGVKFSNGDTLDASAVIASTNRMTEGKATYSDQFMANVRSMEAPDPRTVTYYLNNPWTDFPVLLTTGFGMITHPDSFRDGSFVEPIGVGPYTVKSVNPGVELVLAPREDYWGGKPRIGGLKFVDLHGEQPMVDALKAGEVQMAYLRGGDAIETMRAEFPGYYEPVSMVDNGLINIREGRAAHDIRVRQAIVKAIDPVIINERARDGLNSPGLELFQEWSTMHGAIPGPTQDVDAARELVEEAKADGYDGKLTFASLQDPASVNLALAMQSMLQNVGFEVKIQPNATKNDIAKTFYVTHDFDVSVGGTAVPDSAPLPRLQGLLVSGSSQNVSGYSNPKMDEVISQIQAAATPEERRAGFEEMQTILNEDAPIVPLGSGANFVTWAPNVHGAKAGMDGLVLFDKIWISD
ncbi:ABC transporter substrate-binding protein [Rhodococcus sp. TAF43]|uniref:ABC transporter substrate-binding protein n=1 Tax=unclassified Rhodococcus (in: high G+C Gram-positive bacteria) TaxID=192944 RepID=UPI0015830D98|nr:ABC transporter substrate-binding protein [Rhodococcus sp. W8901]QKT13402.1 ABC transporter substrate-binding protein [Rhodococcus sp. W8901]